MERGRILAPSRLGSVEVYRAVRQRFSPDQGTVSLMETFRLMVNDCVRLAADLGKPSYSEVKRVCYARMLEYDVHNSYRASAVYEAANLLKKQRANMKAGHAGQPHVRKPFVSASIGVRLDDGFLIMPERAPLALNGHTLSTLRQQGNGLVSACLTPVSLSVVYKRDVAPVETSGAVALDINLENITTCDDEGRVEVYSLSRLVQNQERYRRVTSRFRRRDRRIGRQVFRKYARIKRAKRDWLLHEVTSLIVARAAALKQTVAMENLRGMREMYRKESKSSAYYLSQMNAWPFAESQRQIGYKAKWFGLPVVYVEPEGTSSNCSRCGGALSESANGDRMMTCRGCGLAVDRDVNAARRILSRALRSRDLGPADEAMEGGASRGSATAPKVDAGHSARTPGGEDQNIASSS